ncbi:type I restriction enzyme, S subunit, partial [Candidatus Electrothrix aarhusensis]
DGWGDLLSIQYGKSPKAILSATGCYPVWGTGGVTGKTYEYLHEGDSIVIGRKGTIDKPQFVTGKFWVIDTAYYASNFNGCLPKWLYYAILNLGIKKYNESTGVPSLNRETIYSISSLHPPLQEQKKIAEILTSVDVVIEKTEAQISKLRDLKKAMMTELLTKGIGHTEFKDSPVGRIPAAWKVFPLGGISQYINGHVFKPGSWTDKGYQIIRIQNLNGGTDFNCYNGIVDENWMVESGDLLFAWSGQRGKSFGARIWNGSKGVLNQHIFKVISDERYVTKAFLHSKLQQIQVELEAKAHGFKDSFMHVKKGEITAYQVALAGKKEQEKIVGILSSIERCYDCAVKKLTQTKTLKKALMHDLLTGKKRVKVAAD